VSKWTGTPAYLRIAGEYRTRILEGELPPDTKLPSESELMREYDVSRMVAKMAIQVLRNEGLIYSHPGKGSFVKSQNRLVRDVADRYRRKKTPPFKSDAERVQKTSTWEHITTHTTASVDVAARLGIAPNDPVTQTRYRFFADEQPIQLSTSWEPLAITGGTPIELPEESPVTGVVARMDSIGVHADHVNEKVTARAARPDEIARLELPQQGAYVLVIARTHYVDKQPIETCDIIFPGDRYELTYDIPIEPPHKGAGRNGK
jgi:DNA-binding GntR family transcriptional regulator